MSFYASDPANADELIQNLTRVFDTGARTTHWHALMDLAFDEGRTPWPLSTPPVPLYGTGHLGQLRAVSPVLVEIQSAQPQEAAKLLRRLNRHAAGRPMLSFVASTLSAAALAEALQPVLEVETADGQAFVLRLADTRVLPILPAALTVAHWSQVCAPIDGWHAIDRLGALTALPIPPRAGPAAVPASRIRLDDKELAELLRAGEADALICALDEGFAEWLPQQSRAAMHLEVCHVCDLAQTHGIEGAPDRLALVVVNRLAGGALWRDTKLAQWLEQGSWPRDRFSDALGEFVERLK